MSEPTLRQRALNLLARREHTALELRKKLSPHALDQAELTELLDDLLQRGWLSEERFSEQLIHARKVRYGAQRIAHELKEKGVSGETVAALLPMLKETELETACTVWARKFGVPPADGKERARQVRFLTSRGFSQEVIWKVLKEQERDH